MILGGLFLVAVGAILNSLAPTKAICVCREWFVAVGYSLELIPLMVKVAAINRLITQSRTTMRRIEVKRSRLYQIVGGFILVVCIYLSIWTALDPPLPQTEMTLTNAIESGEYVVEVSNFCSSSSNMWKVGAYVYLFILLIVEAAIATQNRGIRQEFNESRQMLLMIYSQVMFIVMRLAVFLFSDNLDQKNQVSAILAILLSLDVITTICIYFVPKILAATKKVDNPSRNTSSNYSGNPMRESRRSSFEDTPGHVSRRLSRNNSNELDNFDDNPDTNKEEDHAARSKESKSEENMKMQEEEGGGDVENIMLGCANSESAQSRRADDDKNGALDTGSNDDKHDNTDPLCLDSGWIGSFTSKVG